MKTPELTAHVTFTGGPGYGKTTLVNMFRDQGHIEVDGAWIPVAVVPEVATDVINWYRKNWDELRKLPTGERVYMRESRERVEAPWTLDQKFQPIIARMQAIRNSQARDFEGIVLHDRNTPDCLRYASQLYHSMDEIDEDPELRWNPIYNMMYAASKQMQDEIGLALLVEGPAFVTIDEVRHEDTKEAEWLARGFKDIYERWAPVTRDVPRADRELRLRIAQSHIADYVREYHPELIEEYQLPSPQVVHR